MIGRHLGQGLPVSAEILEMVSLPFHCFGDGMGCAGLIGVEGHAHLAEDLSSEVRFPMVFRHFPLTDHLRD